MTLTLSQNCGFLSDYLGRQPSGRLRYWEGLGESTERDLNAQRRSNVFQKFAPSLSRNDDDDDIGDDNNATLSLSRRSPVGPLPAPMAALTVTIKPFICWFSAVC